MPIETKDLNVKISGSQGASKEDLIYGDIEEGLYNAELAIVYPWKSITRDTRARIKDEDGKYVKDENGKYIKEDIKELTWYSTDMVFKIIGGMYDGYAVKGSIATHPDMIGSAKRFLYSARLFDVELKDLKDNTGTKVAVFIKNKTESYKDKDGFDVTQTKPYVSYYEVYKEDAEEDLGV